MSHEHPPDCCYASRVLSKHMSSPTDGTRDALIHVIKYLKTHRRCVNKFVANIAPSDLKLDVFSDSDWANNKTDRKSCSGGTILLAGVPLSFWSKTQSNIALSSGEAELNGSVKAISECLSVIHLYDELFHERLETNVHVDSSACKGMLLRSGAGKVKHLSTEQLWGQASAEMYGITVLKIPRAGNCADLLTHSLPNHSAQ